MCRRLLEAQAVYGPHGTALAQSGTVALGRCLYLMLPEDRFDRQPLASEEGRLLMVAEARIDNREELLEGLGDPTGREIADGELLFRGWLRWGEGLLGRIAGDYAFAVWDARREVLTLARDTAGERPLHYCAKNGFVAFATMGRALLSLPGMEAAANEERMAQFVADLSSRGSLSYFKDVRQLEPGHLARISRSGTEVRRYWEPRRLELRLSRQEEYGEALQEQLDRAVKTRLRRVSGQIGSQLSSGYDSSAVTTSAATWLRSKGERLFSFTSAPRVGYDAPVPLGRIGDESPAAAATAALHSNIDHLLVRPTGISPLSLLEKDHALAGQPVGHLCNNVWWSAINERARDLGVTVMLTGEAGNFSLSAGPPLDPLADLFSQGRLAVWLREAWALTRGGYTWINILNASLGPRLPERLYLALRKLKPDVAAVEHLAFVAPQWRAEMARQEEAWGWSTQPAADSKSRRWALLQTFDPGNYRKRSLARWGIEERDPTADRRLVEFCFSLPTEAFLYKGVSKPAMRRALGSRLPPEVMEQKLRGYQMADWHEQLSGDEVRCFVAKLEAAGWNDVVDLAAVRAAANNWPISGWHHRSILYFFRTRLLRALSAASFVNSAKALT